MGYTKKLRGRPGKGLELQVLELLPTKVLLARLLLEVQDLKLKDLQLARPLAVVEMAAQNTILLHMLVGGEKLLC
jgi:hypothetical protein